MVNQIVLEMINYFGTDIKRINHSLKVLGFSKAICAGEQLTENKKIIIELSAVLHDIGIKVAEQKYNSSAGRYQEIEGPPIASTILLSKNIDNAIIQRVCFLIGNHHSYAKIDNIDFQILIEADFLVNIFEDNMSIEVVKSIKHKYFKTNIGNKLISDLYE
jgi:HD superfamily phosphodiesterase